MSVNKTNWYQIDPIVAEWYDAEETFTDDIELIRSLIQPRQHLRILEPFCGTGRILIPLAQDGHEVVGFDKSSTMLDRARTKIADLPDEVQSNISVFEADVTVGEWPLGFDLVVLGGNCFYELATADEQELCIEQAAKSLRPQGYLYLDNNHMEGELDESWRVPGVEKVIDRVNADGVRVEHYRENIWCDVPKRLWRARREWVVTYPDGKVFRTESIQQKHPVSVVEQKEWLSKHGFVIEHLFSGRDRSHYTDSSSRGIFWAKRQMDQSP